MRQTRHVASLLMLSLAIAPASAQVTVDLKALDAVPQTVAPASKPRPAPKPVVRKPRPAPLKPPTAATPARPAPARTAPPPLPSGPPPVANLPPIVPPLAEPGPVLVPPPVSATATGAGAPFAGGLRLTFGPGAGELSPASETALKAFVLAVPASDQLTFNVQAYAPGTAADPSTARRLSLSRALAVRGVLMGAGVASSHIYVRALGAPAASAPGPADRADVTALGANGPRADDTGAGAPAR